MAERDPRSWITALRSSHDQLTALVDPLSTAEIQAPSRAQEWSIAQVLSHLGSQGEIFSGVLTAAVEQRALPGPETFPPVWDAWNGRTPEEQVADEVTSYEALVGGLEALSETQREGLQFALFGMDVDVTRFAGMMLSEHALHSWDVANALDPGATVRADAVGLIIDSGNLSALAGRVGKPQGAVIELRIVTSAPERQLELVVKDDVRLLPSDGDSPRGVLRLPAEALVRLVYGRLHDGDAAGIELDAGDLILADLRSLFPGV